MKRVMLFSLFALALAFALPILLSVPGGTPAAPASSPTPAPAPTPTPAGTAAPVLDDAVTLAVRVGTETAEMTMAEYLPLALAGEMPAAFDAEALKAQAVALRSYALYYRAARKDAHPDADICTDAGCCAARAEPETLRSSWGQDYDKYYDKVCAAVRATDGQYLVWEDAPALAVFHASSAGCTESGAALGLRQDYLVSVDTPEQADTVRNLCTTVEVTAEEFRRAVLSLAPAAELAGAPETWLGRTALNSAGRVAELVIGGQSISGLALRQLFGLRSTDFTLSWDGTCFLFRVRGYGHGLGLSQCGADLMAKAGADYAEILAHYYPGTRLVMAMLS